MIDIKILQIILIPTWIILFIEVVIIGKTVGYKKKWMKTSKVAIQNQADRKKTIKES